MDEQFKQHGAFGWMELMTTDVAPSKRFYQQLFGWETETYPMENMEYEVVKVGGEPKGGIMKMPPHAGDMPPAWGIYVTVDDVDATAKKVVDLGGKVLMEPQDIPKTGRFCVIQDPQGAVISAITYVPEEE